MQFDVLHDLFHDIQGPLLSAISAYVDGADDEAVARHFETVSRRAAGAAMALRARSADNDTLQSLVIGTEPTTL